MAFDPQIEKLANLLVFRHSPALHLTETMPGEDRTFGDFRESFADNLETLRNSATLELYLSVLGELQEAVDTYPNEFQDIVDPYLKSILPKAVAKRLRGELR